MGRNGSIRVVASAVSALLILTEVPLMAESSSDPVLKNIVSVVRRRCPEARVELKDGSLTAWNKTTTFLIHPRTMRGEYGPTPRHEEGPKAEGFLLIVQVGLGPYTGQAATPQVMNGPYYPTFVDAPPTKDGKGHYWVSFSYGSRLDPELKKAVFDALPKPPTKGE